MLALDLLGPVMLRRDGATQPMAVKKTQALLVLLALLGAQPRERIVALLWPQHDESTGRRNLRRELARLRESGVGDAVKSDGDVLLLSAAVHCDVHQFMAAGVSAKALALWHGPLADGLRLEDAAPFEDWLASERERLRGRWRLALETAAEGGPADQAVEQLQTLLADDPLQERHHRTLMRLHLAAGRREAALAQYERCRAVLAEELGLAPMADTEAVMAPVRPASTSGLQPPAATPAVMSAGSSPLPTGLRLLGALPFVGREPEVHALEAAWADGRLLLIEGEGGVGKTRLATDFCAAHGPFAMVRCQPGDTLVPYAAFTRALRALAGEAWADAELPAWVTTELHRLLPELGAAPPPLLSAEDRLRFFEACVLAWQRLADGNFDAVIVDDWQHADASSQSLLAFMAPRLHAGSARLLLLMRPGAQATPAEPLALHLVLAPLATEAVEQLMRQLAGVAAPTRFAARLRRATGGNPFFMTETLRHLAESGALHISAGGRWATPFDEDTEDYRELPLPATVRDAVLARVQRLPEASQRLLEAACLAAEPFAPALLAAACALSELEALAAIELALAAALLREHERGGYAFGHDLARQALEGALSAERRRLVHRRLALAAEATRADPGLVARHFEAGGDAARAVAYRLAAGDDAQRLFAGAQALHHWQTALAGAPSAAQAALLHVRCARAFIDLGEGDSALAAVARVRDLVAAGQLAADERAEAQIAAAEIEIVLNLSPLAMPQIDAVLAQLPAGPQRALALRVRGHALQNLGRLEEAAVTVKEALALWAANLPGTALERAALLDTLQVIEYQRGRVQAALALARQASALWAAFGDRRSMARGHYRIGVMLILTGQLEGGRVELETARRLAAEMHLVEQERDVIVNLIKIHADRGDAAGMLALADEGWRLSPRFARPRIRLILLQAQCHAHSLLGDLGRALAIAEMVLTDSESMAEPVSRQYAVLTVLDLMVHVGDFERGRRLLAQLTGTSELAYLGVKLAFNLAYLEVRAGQPAAARRALAGAGDASALEQPQDRATHALRLAEIHLTEGDPEAALTGLEPWRGDLDNVELQAQVLALRLRAQAAAGRVSAAEWATARAALDDVAMPLLDVLELRHALALSALDMATGAAMAASVHRLCTTIADSLADRPACRSGFLVRFGVMHPAD